MFALSHACTPKINSREKKSELLKHQDGHIFAPGNPFIHNNIQTIHKPVFRSESGWGEWSKKTVLI